MMKSTPVFLLLISILFGVTPSLSFAKQENTSQRKNVRTHLKQKEEPSDPFLKKIQNEPEQVRKQYTQLWGLLQQNIQTSSALGALDICDQLEKLVPGNPSVYNVKGTLHLKLKNIANSKEHFMKAIELAPNNDTFCFNLAETFFVNHEYDKAIALFLPLIAKIEKQNDANIITKSLIQFKIFIAYTKLGDKDKANEYLALYDINDDTPFYYCARGIDNWEKGDKKEAQNDFKSALNIYAPSGMYQPFGDSLVETGYIESLEGPTVPSAKKE